MNNRYDTIIIGGGPAGSSAAKHLGYHRRRVLVIDRRSSPLYYITNPIHNYPCGQSVIQGRKMLQMFQEETKALGAMYCTANVVRIEGTCPDFHVWTESKRSVEEYQCTTLLFATGVARKHPRVGGDWKKWLPYAGKKLICFYCANCEAPETDGKDILVVNVGTVRSALHAARSIQRFAKRIRIFMTEDSSIPFTDKDRQVLDRSEFDWTSGVIDRVEIKAPGQQQTLITTDGRQIECQHFFASYMAVPRSELAAQLGVALTESGSIITDHRGKTNVEGVWAAGDVRAITQQVAMAVGTGNYAAVMINQYLGFEDEPDMQVDHSELRLVPRCL